MSAHIEWTVAENIATDLVEHGVAVGSVLTCVDADYALVIGDVDNCLVIEGTAEELRAVGAQIVATLAKPPLA